MTVSDLQLAATPATLYGVQRQITTRITLFFQSWHFADQFRTMENYVEESTIETKN